jgi:hypothetical protein
MSWKKYRRTNVAEMRPVTIHDIDHFNLYDFIAGNVNSLSVQISISEADLKNGSPKLGDMIARNPENHKDQWLVAEQYYKDNFEEMS